MIGIGSIDVVMPGRGALNGIEPCLESLARQILPAENVYLVDDGIEFPEKVDDLGQRMLGARYRRVPNEGKGISRALNTGVKLSRCDWVARMDTDDVCHPKRFQTQIEFLKRQPDLLGCGTRVHQISERGRLLSTSKHPLSREDIRRFSLRETCFVHPTLMLRREALESTPYRPLFDGAEDVDLILRLLERGDLENIEESLLEYRLGLHQSDVMGRARQTALQELAFRCALMRRKKNRDPVEENPALANAFVQWRVNYPGYTNARHALTCLRYALMYLQGGDVGETLKLSGKAAFSAIRSPTSLVVVSKVLRRALQYDVCPFPTLNWFAESSER